jgi:hypothetical protein
MRSPENRRGPVLVVSLAALCLLTQCHEATDPPTPPQAPPTVAPPAPITQAPATQAPASQAQPDLGFNIVAGAPVIVAEAPIVTADPRKPAPRPATPGPNGAAGGGQTKLSPSPPQTAREVSAQAVIRSHFSDVEACYGAVALKDPSVGGRIVVQWTLGADGTPTGVAITQDTLRSAAVTDCIKARARGWRFPPPAGGVGVVRYPFDLKVQ